MHHIIDAYNLMFCPRMPTWHGHDFQEKRGAFIAYIADFASKNAQHYTLVFDGREGGSRQGHANERLKILFSRGGQSADQLILEIVESLSNPRQYKVISSDRFVMDNAKHQGCQCLNSQDFGQTLKNSRATAATTTEITSTNPPVEVLSREKLEGLSPKEVDFWRDVFDPIDPHE